jgi:hypothetical protein
MQLGQTDGDFDPVQIGESALKLATDDSSGKLSRITAGQVYGRLGIICVGEDDSVRTRTPKGLESVWIGSGRSCLISQ